MSYYYYNVEIFNDTNNFKLARFTETRVVPILTKPNDYELSIIRFKVPSQAIPILVWPGDNVFKVTFTWQGQETFAFLNLPPNIGVPEYGNAIYNYQEFVDSLNAAFANCYNQMSILFPGPWPTSPEWNLFTEQSPIMIYDNVTKFFSIQFPWITPNYTDPIVPSQISFGNWTTTPQSGPSNQIKIFFNEKLGSLLRGFRYNLDLSDNDKYYNLVVQDNKNNLTNVSSDIILTMPQDYTILNSFNDLDDIVFRTNSVPVTNEMIGAQRNILQQILTDFEVTESDFDSSNIQFFAIGPLRYYPLNSNSEMRTLDLQVFWKNKSGLEFPLFIAPGQKLTVKIQFRKVPSIVLKEVLEDQNIF